MDDQASQLILVHSPLLAPSSWGRVPASLEGKGFTVAVADLRPVLESGPPYYERLFQTIAAYANGADAVAVVGHSAAGALLPGALSLMGAGRQTAVFVDARLPHDGQTWLEARSPDRQAALLASVVDGHLPPWDRWFPPEALAELLPDDAMRQRFQEELRGLPAQLLTEPMPQSTWDSRVRKVYVQLSAAYASIADQAKADGWQVARYALDHLAPLTRPDAVADAIATSLAP